MKIKLFILLLFLSTLCFGQTSEKLSVYFKFNKYDLDNTSKNRIDSFINSKTIEHITLQGHTDYEGNDEYNDKLSLKRVQEVRTYLLSKNIKENTIEIKALGERKLLNTSKEEIKKGLNRRVEIEITVKAKEIVKPMVKDSIIPPVKLSPDQKEIIITGIVVDENKRPVKAEVTLSDKKGNEILTATSDVTGRYQIKTALNKKENYSLTYYNDDYFTASEKINLSEPGLPYRNLKTVLQKLKGGNKYILENMNFEGDTSQLIASSLPSLEALYKVMKKNKSLVIRIEGHINYPHWFKGKKQYFIHYVPPQMSPEEACQWLSEERAKTVYNYLVNKGIDPKRLSIIGYGSKKMLFPDAVSEWEMEQNRRVEINVLSFE